MKLANQPWWAHGGNAYLWEAFLTNYTCIVSYVYQRHFSGWVTVKRGGNDVDKTTAAEISVKLND